jgi:hypothetical protein
VDAQAIADAFRLGHASSLSDPVARGELGEIRRLETDRGTWAVKQEFEPWDDEADLPDAEQSGAFQLACWRSGVPCPRPVATADERFSVDVAGEAVRVYTWVGIADPDTGLDPAAVGELVARMHAVQFRPEYPVHEWFEAPIGRREWKGVLKASRAAGAPYADRLADVLPHLVAVESILTPMRPVQFCHLDLWADNLRRAADGGLCVIDFDNCGPADPTRELAMVLFEFGQATPCAKSVCTTRTSPPADPDGCGHPRTSPSPSPSSTTSVTATSRCGSPREIRRPGPGRWPASRSFSASRCTSPPSTASSPRSVARVVTDEDHVQVCPDLVDLHGERRVVGVAPRRLE